METTGLMEGCPGGEAALTPGSRSVLCKVETSTDPGEPAGPSHTKWSWNFFESQGGVSAEEKGEPILASHLVFILW